MAVAEFGGRTDSDSGLMLASCTGTRDFTTPVTTNSWPDDLSMSTHVTRPSSMRKSSRMAYLF